LDSRLGRRPSRPSDDSEQSRKVWRPKVTDQSSEWRKAEPIPSGSIKRTVEEPRKRQESEDIGRGPPRIIRTNSESSWRAREAAKKAEADEGRENGGYNKTRETSGDHRTDESQPGEDDGFTTVIKGRRKK
jgi:hypothetical protein